MRLIDGHRFLQKQPEGRHTNNVQLRGWAQGRREEGTKAARTGDTLKLSSIRNIHA